MGEGGGGQKSAAIGFTVVTQLRKLKTFYRQAMLSDNWAKETILNFILFINISLACVASFSSRGSSRKLGQEQKKNEWRGRWRGKKEPLARKPHDFEKLRSPTNAASDWRGAGSVDYLAFETSIKPGMLCFRASQIWSHLICGRRLQMLWTDIYWNRVCAKVCEIRAFKV